MSTSPEPVNPWTWQDQFGFSQALTVQPPSRWVFCAGQTSVDPDGNVLNPGDIAAQLTQSLDNLETVLDQAGTSLAHVVRLNYYTTEVDGLLGAWHILTERLGAAGCRPTSTLLGVARLAFPDLLLEIEATAFVP
ncbi:MAG: Rid family hydrolase [Micrococcus sp.]|nr:Rid family hydrolase [Micrococcus sp.]